MVALCFRINKHKYLSKTTQQMTTLSLFLEELLFDPETRKTTIETVILLWTISWIILKASKNRNK